MGLKLEDVLVHCDNEGAIQLSKHQVFYDRSKHISVKLHWIRDVINSKEVKVVYVNTNYNVADMFTKSIPGIKFVQCLTMLHIS